GAPGDSRAGRHPRADGGPAPPLPAPPAGLAGAFNLDTDNVISWSGETGSLFGFSLAMHRQLQPQEKWLLLVGAPREKAFPTQQANRTGGLYSCDIASPYTDCMRVNKLVLNSDPTTESKEDQWMGVTVQSQGPGGNVVVSAKRLTYKNIWGLE
uniref:Uncharacterized protein n=1 Tax=Malurus cyaneus samueli TaxID=2593467 RepID=A0A8C5UJM6_9PASS